MATAIQPQKESNGMSDQEILSRKSKSKRILKESLIGYTMIAPWLLGFFLLTVGGMGYSFYLSFTNYNILAPPEWAGISNYVRLFTNDPRFVNSLQRTFLFAFTSVPLRLMVALGVALLFKKRRPGSAFFTTVYYIPSIIGGSVAVAVVWRQIFSYSGVFNAFLEVLGITPRPWLVQPSTAIWFLILLGLWQFGSAMIIFLAGLRQIPSELYEAASIDGASAFLQFLKVTLPLLTPVIFFNLVMSLIGAFQVFASAFLITGGGPLDSTNFYAVYLFRNAFQYGRMGYAAAMGWVLLVIIVFFTALIFSSQKRWVHYSGE